MLPHWRGDVFHAVALMQLFYCHMDFSNSLMNKLLCKIVISKSFRVKKQKEDPLWHPSETSCDCNEFLTNPHWLSLFLNASTMSMCKSWISVPLQQGHPLHAVGLIIQPVFMKQFHLIFHNLKQFSVTSSIVSLFEKLGTIGYRLADNLLTF